MKTVPTNALAKQQRIIDALCADIRDRDATGFPRLDALRHITKRRPHNGNEA